MPNTGSVNRAHFIQQFVSAGFGYVEACRAYDTMISVFKDAIIEGQKICLKNVASIKPVKLEPKVVHMGFKREGKKCKKVSREFILGYRMRFKFSLHRSFVKNHELKWFSSE